MICARFVCIDMIVVTGHSVVACLTGWIRIQDGRTDAGNFERLILDEGERLLFQLEQARIAFCIVI